MNAREHVRRVQSPDALLAVAMARIYCANQYLGPDGVPNPFDPRYLDGGGHFQRDAAWFERMFQVPGAQVVVAESGGAVVGYSLFFTSPAHFPPFASETLRYRSIPGVGDGLAYTYLIVVEKECRLGGLADAMLDLQREICAESGCRVIAHEFFVAPVPNAASMAFHRALAARCGAAFTGHIATHTIQRPDGSNGATVYYAHALIPTNGGEVVLVNQLGAISIGSAA